MAEDGDLGTFARHARTMSRADHRPDCAAMRDTPYGPVVVRRPDPACEGCVTGADRYRWAALAREAEQHLGRPGAATLFP